jgi:hypothetical protein
MQTTVTLSLGEFQLIALTHCLRDLRAIGRQAEIVGGEAKFEKRELSPLLMSMGPRELAAEVAAEGARGNASHPSRANEIDRIVALATELSHARTALDALRVYHDLVDLPDTAGTPEAVHFSADRLRVYVTVTTGRDTDGDFLASMSELVAQARTLRRPMIASEQAALDVADWKLRAARPLRTYFACLGTSGFREIQTWLSLADPGPDHVRITTWDNALLRGNIVHVEYIDRDMIADKEKIEPYRLPASWHAARVRLRVGTEAPCTAFIGRPIFENHAGAASISNEAFEMDLLKTVHMHASACTAMFVNGIADCKIAIERMTAAQAVRFMRAVSGNVLRDPDRQTLSAAFNLNTPIDVVENGVRSVIRGRFEIGKKGIELARAGGFEKVTWDGASSEVPSKPLVEQITHEELTDLVHFAHENGLETYISAGMVAEHMRNAVFAGIDGVGIGTSMHYVDPKTKLMGALKPEAIRAALAVRDEAAAHPLGRAAKALARVDQMHFEGSLLPAEESERARLHEAVRSKDEAKARASLDQLKRTESLEHIGLLSNPTLARGRRRLARLKLEDARAGAGTSELGEALARKDAIAVRELLAR